MAENAHKNKLGLSWSYARRNSNPGGDLIRAELGAKEDRRRVSASSVPLSFSVFVYPSFFSSSCVL